eukprot:jgi/Hompol1/4160/HPOL_006950-RA
MSTQSLPRQQSPSARRSRVPASPTSSLPALQWQLPSLSSILLRLSLAHRLPDTSSLQTLLSRLSRPLSPPSHPSMSNWASLHPAPAGTSPIQTVALAHHRLASLAMSLAQTCSLKTLACFMLLQSTASQQSWPGCSS